MNKQPKYEAKDEMLRKEWSLNHILVPFTYSETRLRRMLLFALLLHTSIGHSKCRSSESCCWKEKNSV